METWEKELRDNALVWADKFNKIGLADSRMTKFLNELVIHWVNESNEWRETFVKRSKPEKLCFLIDSLI